MCEADRLVLGLQDDLRCPGWTDLAPDLETTGAVGPSGELPRPKLLVPDRRALAWATRPWGHAEPTNAVAVLSAAPHPVTAAQRRPPQAEQRWPRAHPVVLELETLAPGPTDTSEPRRDNHHDAPRPA